MKHLSSGASLAWKGLTALHVLGIAFTFFRLSIRLRMSKIWWDDYLVVIPCLVDIFYLGVLWAVPITPTGEILMNNVWFAFLPPMIIMWLSRSVLALGLARIFPPQSPARRLNVGLALFFFPATVAAGAIAIDDICNTYRGTGPVMFPTCLYHPSSRILTHVMTTAQLASDSTLALCPMTLFRNVRLTQAERHIILLTLACGVVPCLTPLVFTILHYYTGIDVKTMLNFVCQLTSALCLTVSNLLVVVASGIRASRRRRSKALVTSHPPARIGNCDLNHKSKHKNQSNITRRAAPAETFYTNLSTKTKDDFHITLTEIFESYIGTDSIS